MSFATNWNKTVSMFAIACMCAIVVGPMAIIFGVAQLNEFPGRFSRDAYAAGEELRVSEPGRMVSIWGFGEELDRDAVSCTDHGEAEALTDEAAHTTVGNRSFTLLLDDDYTVLNELSCAGGGLEELRVSTRTPESRAIAFIVGGSVATVVLVPVGFVLWRVTARRRREENAEGIA